MQLAGGGEILASEETSKHYNTFPGCPVFKAKRCRIQLKGIAAEENIYRFYSSVLKLRPLNTHEDTVFLIDIRDEPDVTIITLREYEAMCQQAENIMQECESLAREEERIDPEVEALEGDLAEELHQLMLQKKKVLKCAQVNQEITQAAIEAEINQKQLRSKKPLERVDSNSAPSGLVSFLDEKLEPVFQRSISDLRSLRVQLMDSRIQYSYLLDKVSTLLNRLHDEPTKAAEAEAKNVSAAQLAVAAAAPEGEEFRKVQSQMREIELIDSLLEPNALPDALQISSSSVPKRALGDAAAEFEPVLRVEASLFRRKILLLNKKLAVTLEFARASRDEMKKDLLMLNSALRDEAIVAGPISSTFTYLQSQIAVESKKIHAASEELLREQKSHDEKMTASRRMIRKQTKENLDSAIRCTEVSTALKSALRMSIESSSNSDFAAPVLQSQSEVRSLASNPRATTDVHKLRRLSDALMHPDRQRRPPSAIVPSISVTDVHALDAKPAAQSQPLSAVPQQRTPLTTRRGLAPATMSVGSSKLRPQTPRSARGASPRLLDCGTGVHVTEAMQKGLSVVGHNIKK
eukprot:m51a1_g458 hypothetical protein (577) ;mRNA; f:158196-160086